MGGSTGRWGRGMFDEGRVVVVGTDPGIAGRWAKGKGPRRRVDPCECRRMCPRGALRFRAGGS